MEQKELAIHVDRVSKVYKLYRRNRDRLIESLGLTKKKLSTPHYALKDVSLDIYKGETVGIIGTNGSGKSTILKIITGVLHETSGTVQVNGRISALLELGAGFNMEYNGIENIYLNGTMIGFSEKEIDEKLQDILDFAEIGDFVYQPVKTYSSGMFVRLAFALAINVDPEILIVDEALSVGDVFFQSKCYRRMEEIRKKGTTILMVTHDMGSIIKYCDKVVLLHKGEFIAEGPAGKVVDMYKKILAGKLEDLRAELAAEKASENGDAVELLKEKSSAQTDTEKNEGTEMSDFSGGMNLSHTGLMRDQLAINTDRTEYGDGRAEIYDLGLLDARGNVTNLLLKGETFTIKECIRFHADIQTPIFTYTIKDKKGTELTGTNTMFEGADIKPVKNGDEYTVEFTQKMNLQGGEYLLSMSCTGFEQGEHVVYHRLYDVTNITVISNKNTVGVYDMESQVKAEKRNADE